MGSLSVQDSSKAATDFLRSIRNEREKFGFYESEMKCEGPTRSACEQPSHGSNPGVLGRPTESTQCFGQSLLPLWEWINSDGKDKREKRGGARGNKEGILAANPPGPSKERRQVRIRNSGLSRS